jgi:glycosyltransferase involved in cell wall biosynthesis
MTGHNPPEPIIDGAMRILVLTNMYPPHAYGGYEMGCRDVVERWRRAGHEVMVLTSTTRVPGQGPAPSEDPRQVRRELRLYWDDHVILSPPLVTRWRIERHNRHCLGAALADFGPDVVSAWAMGAMSMGLLSRLGDLGVPVVSVVADEWPVYGPHVDAWLRPLAARPGLARVVGAATGLSTKLPPLDELGPTCFASEAMRTKLRGLSPWSFPRSAIVPWGIDAGVFRIPAAAPERPWRWRLLHAGRVDERKGIATVIEALALCPQEATLEVLGRGDAGHLLELRALADDLGVTDRVTFGECDREELAVRYGQADALVFAPLWDEPFGLVPLEAMACGTPVVASPTGGATEFMSDGTNCLTFPPGDAPGLAGALVRLSQDPALRARVVSGGLETAAYYTVDRLAADLEGWHQGAREWRASAGTTAGRPARQKRRPRRP